MKSKLRESSWKKVLKLNLPINEKLPLLDEVEIQRTELEIFNRLMCLLPFVASTYGFPRDQSMKWIIQEKLEDYISNVELNYIRTGDGDLEFFRQQIEAMWILAWSLNIIKDLNFTKDCSDDFVTMLPDLKKMESSKSLRLAISLRSKQEITSCCDFAYCIHWSIRQMELDGKNIPFNSSMIQERRRALEWIISRNNWYEISLDT